jgi:hypothetical protein
MPEIMPETIPVFLERVRQAAVVLENPETLNLISSVQEQVRAPRLRILVVGEPASGRFALVNALLGQPALLPSSPIPRTSSSVRVSYGDTTTVEALARDQSRFAMPLERLRPFLTSADAGHDASQQVDVRTPSDLLKTSDITIATIESNRTTQAWRELLACSDYTILVLKATALLSEQEKRFIREVLQPDFGLERVAIVVNQMDLVAEAERPSIAELVRTFLGSFERQPLLLEVSAAQALQGLESGSMPPESGYDALMRLVRDDLIEQHRSLKASAMRQAASICFAELQQEATRQHAVITTSEEELNTLAARLDAQDQWLAERIQRTQHRIETFVDTLIKEQFLREIEGFNAAFRAQFADEIMGIDSVQTIKRNLTGYIEAVWTEFFNYQLGFLRSRLGAELKLIGELVTDDLKTLVGAQAPRLQPLLDSFDPLPANLKAFIMPSRGNHQAGTVATWMQVGGFVLLIANLQLSLGLIGVGQAIRIFFERDIQSADKQAIAKAVIDASYELEPQIKYQVQHYFASLTDELKQAIAEHYRQGVATLRQSLEHDIAHYHDIHARKAAVEHLLHATIPDLQQARERIG